MRDLPDVTELKSAMLLGVFVTLSQEWQIKLLTFREILQTPEYQVRIYCRSCDRTFQDEEEALKHRRQKHWES